ncbi:hypothetical protein DSC45_05265 [Streptomyces sp. YIM 130001]|uniref:hypothetical protein n=1 Tax=Streptomyces sp. YIM 130001 TaxID=2259644 RepID=UPI000E64E566|nr:hypothetical protein [Streptomyces sp. YIM 130001]RII20617.1 hypothetical protein DSC45_05265 [Streptomyces sp. YIM 130001]
MPRLTVRPLVTTQRTSGISGRVLNPSIFDEEQLKRALVTAKLIPTPKVTVKQGKGTRTSKSIDWDNPREHRFHVLLHTFASIVLQAGKTIAKLTAWLGRSDPAFTLRAYIHFLPEAGQRGLATLGRWISRAGAEPQAAAEADAEDGLPPTAPQERMSPPIFPPHSLMDHENGDVMPAQRWRGQTIRPARRVPFLSEGA